MKISIFCVLIILVLGFSNSNAIFAQFADKFLSEYRPIADNIFQYVVLSPTKVEFDDLGTTSVKGSTNTTTIAFEQYGSNLEIRHPPDWQIEEFDDGIRLLSLIQNPSDSYREVLDILIENTDSKSASDHVLQTLTDYSNVLDEFNLISSGTSTISGNPAYELVYSYEDANFGTSQARDIITVQDGNVYTISFVAPFTTFSNFNTTVEQIVDSIKIS